MTTSGAVVQSSNTTYVSSMSSGLDTNSLVEAAVAQKTAPADRIDVRVAENDLKIEGYKELQTLSANVENSLENLSSRNYSSTGGANDFDRKQAYLSSPDLATPTEYIAVSADESAIATNYNIEVLQLAQKMKVSGSPQDSTAPLGLTGEFSLGLEGGNSSLISVTPDMDMAAIVDAINAASATSGVSASAIAIDSSTSQLVLSADKTASNITFSTVSGDDILASLGVTDGLGNFTTVTQNAQPSRMMIDGTEVTRDSNEIDDAISGVSFSLLGAQPGAVITLDIDHDYGAVKTSITDFIDSYNELREYILKQQEVSEDGTVPEDSVLFADSLLRNMNGGIHDLLNRDSYGTPSGVNNLSQLGIEMDSSNRLYLVDENKLDTRLLTDFSATENFFETTYTSSDERLRILNNDSLSSELVFSMTVSADANGKISDVQVGGQSGLFEYKDNLITGKAGTAYEGLSFALSLDPSEVTTIDVGLDQGFADGMRNYLDVYSDGGDGLIQKEINSLSQRNSELRQESEKIRSDAEVYREKEIEKYAKMETELQEAELLRKQIEAILGGNDDDD